MKEWFPLFFLSISYLPGVGQTIVLTPQQDNTIFSENSNSSSGAGTDLYVGKTGSNANNSLRRALLQFKLDTIPPNATINSVSLIINCTKVSPFANGANNIGLYVATQAWGEGSSVGTGGAGVAASSGDATWTCRFSNGAGGCTQSWTTAGGDHMPVANATVDVNGAGAYTFNSNAALIAAVKRWVDTPAVNFGWELIGDEANAYTSRAFGSKESGSQAAKLTVDYSLPACTSNTWTGLVNNAWETAGNWSCNMVPDSSMQVIINSGTVLLSTNTEVKSLQLSNGASFSTAPGVTLKVLQ